MMISSSSSLIEASSSSSSSSSTISIVETNEQRCAEILECKKQIEYWTSKLEALESQQEHNIKLARLRLDACSTWRCLSRQERLEKPFILAALESEEIPPILEEFPNSFPPHLRLDKDILLKRVSRPDFIRKYRDDRFFVPPRFRNDKQLVLSIIPKHPQVIECISCELRNDDDVLDSILQLPNLPSYFLQHFSERIRSHKTKMMKVLTHRDGLSCLMFCSQSLRNDKQFILHVIEYGNHNQAPEVLRFVSHRLRNDYDVVIRIVEKSGLNLKHAAYELRRNYDIVAAASEQDPSAFRYCLPGPTKQQFLKDRDFVLSVVSRSPSPNNVTKTCIERYKNDEEVLLQALVSGCLEWNGLDVSTQSDECFLLKALQRNPCLYTGLPDDKREDFNIALYVVQCGQVSDDVILEATDCCPQLLADRGAMLSICKNWWTDVMQETLQFSPPEIRSDKEIMIEAVKSDSIAFEYCTEELQQDRDIVISAIESSPNILYMVPNEFQIENPDIVIMCIKNIDSGDLWSMYDDIYDELWTNRDVALAWLTAGGEWLIDDFPSEFSKDTELLLTVAKHNWDQFENACHDDLLKNKEFMLKAIQLDGRIIRDIPDELSQDYDLALTAFSNDSRSLQYYSDGDDFEFMVSFTKRVRSRLNDSYMFSNEVVGTILRPTTSSSSSSSPSSDDDHNTSHLTMLNQGHETVHMYKTKISSFLGLPDENEIQQLESASQNLIAWGF